MQKIISLILVLVFCLSLCACGNANIEEEISESKTSTLSDFAEPTNTNNDTVKLPGTWQAVGIEVDGSTFSIDELVTLGTSGGLENFSIILKDGGKGCYIFNGNIFNWSFDNQLILDGVKCIFEENIIKIPAKDFIVLLEKTSDNQTITDVPAIDSSSATEAVSATGIRPEFKAAMDSYEAFYVEYCKLLKQYKANPTDLSILTKYGQLMAKTEDMNKAFEAWDDGSLNDEELKYYLDVNNRVMQMMVDAAS